MRSGSLGVLPTTWRGLPVLLVGVAVTFGLLTPSSASIVLNPTGGGLGSASVVFQGGLVGTSIFHNPAVGFGPIPLPNVIIEKTFQSAATIVFDDVTYVSGDLNWTGGFRWTERIHNDTPLAWTDYHLTLSDTTGTWFSDLPTFTPGLVTINNGLAISTVSGVNTVVRIPGNGIISADRKELWFYFSTPVASGSFFDIHTAIQGLPTSGSFQLAQAPSFVPEPFSFLIWTALGILGITVAWWRRTQ